MQSEPLILLPGTLCNQRLFEPMLSGLDGHQAVTIDIAGAESAPDMARLILARAPDRFALLGFSLGGIVAMEMIAQAPERVSRLALISTTARPDPAGNAIQRRRSVARARQFGIDSYTEENWLSFVGPQSREDRSLKELVVLMAREAGIEAFAQQAEIAINRVDSRPRLKAITVPTLVLAGTHDPVCRLDAHREIADAIDGALFATIETGHFAPLEAPEAVRTHVADWLRRKA